ncbi:phosphate transporter (Pho88) [Saitoella coloradoensis]
MAMNSQIAQLVIVLGVMQLSKKFDWEDPQTVFYARTLYTVSNVIIFAIYTWIGWGISKKNDLTTLKYVEPASPMGGSTTEKVITTTNRDYDSTELAKLRKSQLTGVAMMAVMHFYFKFSQPLLIQSILPIKSALESKLAQIYVLNRPEVGDLARPWKVASMFGAAAEGPKTDKASIKAAEKKAGVGKKDE